MSSIAKSDDDCYFFFNATCTKGAACPFRHSDAAFGSDVVCSFWREGTCIKGVNCAFRHMEIRKSRKQIECFFEKQPGGCKKPYCPFLHTSRLVPKASNEDLEATSNDPGETHSQLSGDQFSSAKVLSIPSDQEIKSDNDPLGDNLKTYSTPPFSPNSFSSKSLQPTSPSSSTVATVGSEPVSFHIDIAEESENEPEESSHTERKSIKLTSSNHVEQNFGVKTLEQIRLEKVFRQNDVNKISSCETSSTPSSSGAVSRIRLKRKSLTTTTTTNTSTLPGASNIMKKEENNKPTSPNVSVKSLEEIRQEKEQACTLSEMTLNEAENVESKPKRVIKIKRAHLGIGKPTEPPNKLTKSESAIDGTIQTEKSILQSSSPSLKVEPKIVQSEPKPQPQVKTVEPVKPAPIEPTKEPTSIDPVIKPTIDPPTEPITSTTSSIVTKPFKAATSTTQPTPAPTSTLDPAQDGPGQNISPPKPTRELRPRVAKLKNVPVSTPSPPKNQKTKSARPSKTVSPKVTKTSPARNNNKRSASKTLDSSPSPVKAAKSPGRMRTRAGAKQKVDTSMDSNEFNDYSSSDLMNKETDEKPPTKKQRLSRTSSTSSSSPSKLDNSLSDWNGSNLVTSGGTHSISKDDDLLDDDLLADEGSGVVNAPDDISIEVDEEDEFLKEIEHVINS